MPFNEPCDYHRNMIGFKMRRKICLKPLSCLRPCAVGGLGRKGSYRIRFARPVEWDCTCALALFYGRVQVHRIRPTNTVPGAKVIRNTRPAASLRSFGRKGNLP